MMVKSEIGVRFSKKNRKQQAGIFYMKIRFSNSFVRLLANHSASFWSGACILIANETTDQETPELVQKLIKTLE